MLKSLKIFEFKEKLVPELGLKLYSLNMLLSKMWILIFKFILKLSQRLDWQIVILDIYNKAYTMIYETKVENECDI